MTTTMPAESTCSPRRLAAGSRPPSLRVPTPSLVTTSVPQWASPGTTIVVGASSHDSTSAGRAYVFTKTASGGKQVAELSSPGTSLAHISVAISGTTIVVGWNYPNTPVSGPLLPGVACVYTKTATGWCRTAVSKGPNTTSFGYSVAVSGSTVVVGAISAPPADPVGRAYVYTKTATGWRQSAVLNSPDTANAFSFGFSTAISGSTALVGSDGTGSVYVFTKTPTQWTNVAGLHGSDTVTGDGFGSTLAVSGTTALSARSSRPTIPAWPTSSTRRRRAGGKSPS